MTLPAWDPSNHSTFSVNVGDLAYFVLPDMSSAADQAALVVMRALFDATQIPVVTLLPQARNFPSWSVFIFNVAGRVSVALDVSRYVLAIARERSVSALQATWVDFTDGGRVNSTNASLLAFFTP